MSTEEAKGTEANKGLGYSRHHLGLYSYRPPHLTLEMTLFELTSNHFRMKETNSARLNNFLTTRKELKFKPKTDSEDCVRTHDCSAFPRQ